MWASRLLLALLHVGITHVQPHSQPLAAAAVAGPAHRRRPEIV
ncbi:MAG: hypothetical protein Q8M32_11410 [Brevundimonas sp.]|nr:hypothetical protein [Brevundimonas sp.]